MEEKLTWDELKRVATLAKEKCIIKADLIKIPKIIGMTELLSLNKGLGND